ncbi:MAG: carbohydrate kinase family protein [Candidatus Saccharibacteria bacterium]|nr:carbohydrate kinase family protein [Candidatus Saccharibacteria bacterium]
MARIVAVGSALQDIYLIDHDDFVATKTIDSSVSKLGQIVVGTKVDIDRVSFEIGGGGTNAAVTFARHGHDSIYIGNIGHDPAGDAVIDVLNDEGVDTSYINHVRSKTGVSVVLLDTKSGERTILTCRGASGKFNNLDSSDLDMIKPDWIYVSSLRGDMDTLLSFFEKAHEIGCKVMFNPGKLELDSDKKLKGLLEDVDILLVNKTEASQIVPGTILEELLSHLSNYVPTAIITSGSMGGIATDGKNTYRFGIYEDVPVKDTTGAGDGFGSGFLAHYAAGHSFKDSLIFASANSTAVVEKLGAKAGILYGDEELHPMPIQEIDL